MPTENSPIASTEVLRGLRQPTLSPRTTVLRVAKRSAVKNLTIAANQMRALVTTAPQELRDELRDLSTSEFVETAAALRFAEDPDMSDSDTRELCQRHAGRVVGR